MGALLALSGFSINMDLGDFWTMVSDFFNAFWPVIILLAAPAVGIGLAMLFGDKIVGIFSKLRGSSR